MSSDIMILQRNGCPTPMARLSSLERMLSSIQQREEDEEKGEPPALPHRPVSKARTPPGRRRAVLSFISCAEEFEAREVLKSKRTNREGAGRTESYQEHECDLVINNFVDINRIGEMKEKEEEKRAVEIQKWFRGHKARCSYHHLNSAIISLQSFVRGENGRNNYQLALLKRHRENRLQVPDTNVAELQRRVKEAEAELGNKNEENAFLQLRLEQFDRRWQQYEAKMKFMEKMWQDQLAAIQARLVAENGRRARENPDITQNGTSQVNGRVYTIKHYIEQHERGMEDDDPNCDNVLLESEQLDSNPEKELKKLKFRFKAWNKDYKTRLRETKATLNRPENSKGKKVSKRWWER